MRVLGCGDFERLEAVDARGQFLVPPPDPAQAAMFRENPQLDPALHTELHLRSGMTYQSQLPLPLRLKYPERPGTQISRLEGALTLAVAGRRDDPKVPRGSS